jgi:hypothetical protein
VTARQILASVGTIAGLTILVTIGMWVNERETVDEAHAAMLLIQGEAIKQNRNQNACLQCWNDCERFGLTVEQCTLQCARYCNYKAAE